MGDGSPMYVTNTESPAGMTCSCENRRSYTVIVSDINGLGQRVSIPQ